MAIRKNKDQSAKKNGTWTRFIQSDMAQFPVKVRSYPEEITELAIAPGESGGNIDLEDSLVPIGLDPSTYQRQKTSHTRGNDLVMGFNDTSKSVSSSMWSSDPEATVSSTTDDFSGNANQKGRDPLLRRSGMVQCRRCGEYVEPNRTRKTSEGWTVCAKPGSDEPTCRDWRESPSEAAPRRDSYRANS
jgi:hypothetical protein